MRTPRLLVAISFLGASIACSEPEDVPIGLREPVAIDRANLRYAEVEVEGLSAANGTHLLVVASGVDGHAVTSLDPERRTIRFAYDPDVTAPDAVVTALGREGQTARVTVRDALVPEGFLPEHMRP